jgi:hypothetical protein
LENVARRRVGVVGDLMTHSSTWRSTPNAARGDGDAAHLRGRDIDDATVMALRQWLHRKLQATRYATGCRNRNALEITWRARRAGFDLKTPPGSPA